MMTRSGVRALMAPALLLALLALFGATASAQEFDANRYYRQCLSFEVGGDLGAAQRACENALQVDPSFVDARLALARIEVQQGNYGSAETRLEALRRLVDSAEPDLLLAEVSLATDRADRVPSLLASARRALDVEFNRELAARLNYLEGQMAANQGEIDAALEAYQRAIALDGLDVGYRLADAELRLEVGDAAGARDQLLAYEALAASEPEAAVRSLLGRSHWAVGDGEAAIDALNSALTLRTSREADAQVDDLVALSLIYYGQGNLRSGGVALRGAMQRGNLLNLALSNTLLWVGLLLVVLAVLLVGESRIAPTSTLEVVEGPQPWTVGDVYRSLIAAVLLGLLAMLVYGLAVYGDALALFAPVIGDGVRGIGLLVFSLVLAFSAIQTVRRNGFDAGDALLSGGSQASLGVLVGLLMLAVTLGYLAYRPDAAWLGEFYLDLGTLQIPAILAALLLPLTELFFRPFAMTALRRRYDVSIAAVLSVGLYALVLGTPIVLLLVLGGLAVYVYRRSNGGLPPFLAMLVLHLGLVLGVTLIPWVRALVV